MSEVIVAFWTGTGNTAEMAEYVAEGIREGGAEGFASGKTIGLFGSYGWGDGEWMRNWVEQMEGAGATVVGGEDAICQEAPDEDAQDELKAMGKQLAAI